MSRRIDLTAFRADGFQVARRVLSDAEVAGLIGEFGRLKNLAFQPPAPDVRALWVDSHDGTRLLRGLQQAHLVSTVIDAVRLHPEVGWILQSVLGGDVTTIITTAFWKSPGAAETGIAYHQDAGFRRPESAYRNLSQSYVQIAIALDPQDEENGALRFIPGSHHAATLIARAPGSVLTGSAGSEELEALGVDPRRARTVRLEPGDAVFWNAYTLHGSGPNRSRDRDRRSLTIGAMRSADCDAGVPTYAGGNPLPPIGRHRV